VVTAEAATVTPSAFCSTTPPSLPAAAIANANANANARTAIAAIALIQKNFYSWFYPFLNLHPIFFAALTYQLCL